MKFLSLQQGGRVKVLCGAAILSLFVLIIFATPIFEASAQSLNIMSVCGGDAPNCDFGDFLELVRRIMNFIILLSIPLATIAFAYAGYLFLTSGSSSNQVSDAKKIFTKILWGFFFVLAAWLIVRTITSALLKPGAYYDPLATRSVATLTRDC